MEEQVKKSNVVATIIKSFLYLGAYLIIQVIVSVVYGIKLATNYIATNGFEAMENAEGFTQYVTENMNTNVILLFSIFITFGIILIVMTAKRKSAKEFFAINPVNKKLIPLFILLGISINLVMAGLINLMVKIPSLETTMQEYVNKSVVLVQDNMVLDILVLVIFVPILEEIIFRVLPLNKMIPRVSPVIAVILTSIAFGISHGQIIWVIYTSLFGVLLAELFLKYKSSISNIIVHSMFNLTSLILAFLPIEVENEFKVAIMILIIGVVIFILTVALFKVLNKKKVIKEEATE